MAEKKTATSCRDLAEHVGGAFVSPKQTSPGAAAASEAHERALFADWVSSSRRQPALLFAVRKDPARVVLHGGGGRQQRQRRPDLGRILIYYLIRASTTSLAELAMRRRSCTIFFERPLCACSYQILFFMTF